MYLDAMSFLEDEREGWRPYESLLQLGDAAFERPVDAARGWSASDLMGHMIFWRAHLLDAARELAVGDASPALVAMAAAWAADEDGLNARAIEAWRVLPIVERRTRAATVPGELRGYLTAVPETRWLKHPDRLAAFLESSIDHDDEHRADLAAILSAAG